jgi:hypothetical protein
MDTTGGIVVRSTRRQQESILSTTILSPRYSGDLITPRPPLAGEHQQPLPSGRPWGDRGGNGMRWSLIRATAAGLTGPDVRLSGTAEPGRSRARDDVVIRGKGQFIDGQRA